MSASRAPHERAGRKNPNTRVAGPGFSVDTLPLGLTEHEVRGNPDQPRAVPHARS